MTVAELVAWLAAEPARSGLYLDFDGTLAPIVSDPRSSRMGEGVDSVLAELAIRLGLVAVVSGRPAAFLAERAAVPGVRLLGLYGLEEWRDGSLRVRPEVTRWHDKVVEATRRLAAAFAGVEGVYVEGKGLAVAVHWRNAADRVAAETAVIGVVAEIADATGLAREAGKFVEELRPPVAWDKGATVTATAAEANLARVTYIGDDLGDLPAFAAVRTLGGLAIVVDQGSETPGDLLAAADLRLAGSEAVSELLAALAAALR